jgi:hypothetical protein
MSTHGENRAINETSCAGSKAPNVDGETVSKIYDCVWSERRPPSGEYVTPDVQREYSRQSSVGMPEAHPRELKFGFTKLDTDLHYEPSPRGVFIPYRLPQGGGRFENTEFKILEHQHTPDRHEPRIFRHREERPVWEEQDRKLCQKVTYPDGSSRVVLKDREGNPRLVVNPDGTRLERQPGAHGAESTWKAFSRHGVEIVADSFRGRVALSADGQFSIVKNYPVPQTYKQDAAGNYERHFKGGATETWDVKNHTKTISGPGGKTRTISYDYDSNGVLREKGFVDSK